MANRLHNVKLNEVSLVDSPANKHAMVQLFKRDDSSAGWEDGNYPSGIRKREFSDKERKRLAGTGAAMPGGGYPIEDEEDLKNAIRAIGRAKNPEKTKAHIRSRAKSLGLTDLIPDTWGKRDSGVLVMKFFISRDKDFAQSVQKAYGDGQAVSFDQAQAAAEESETCAGIMQEVNEAVCSLGQAIWSVQADDTVSDKGEAIAQALSEFGDHVKTIVPEGVENALVAQALAEAGYTINEQGGIQIAKGADSMTIKAIAKHLGLAETATETEILAAMQKADKEKADKEKAEKEKAEKLDAAIGKMSAKHKGYMAHPDAKMPSGGKEAFAEMSPAERDKHMSANPVGGDDDDNDVEKMIAAGDAFRSVDGAVITKRDAGTMFNFFKSQNDEIAKSRKDAAESRDTLAKRDSIAKAGELVMIGKAEDLGTLLFDLNKADSKLGDRVMAVFKHAAELVKKGGVFKEHGSSHANGGSATDRINAGAKELLKSEPTLKTIEKARTEFRKRNPDLKKMEDEESAAARPRAA